MSQATKRMLAARKRSRQRQFYRLGLKILGQDLRYLRGFYADHGWPWRGLPMPGATVGVIADGNLVGKTFTAWPAR